MRPGDPLRLARFTRGAYAFARADLQRPAMRAELAERIETRDERFLAVLQDAVYGQPGSPYLALLRHAGVEQGDVEALVRTHGLDVALAKLDEAGVHVGTEEVRGRAPIVRSGGLELHVRAVDFDNPLVHDGYRGMTGGSTGAPRPTVLDPGSLVESAIHQDLWVESAGVATRPLVLWRSVPPSRAGIRNAFLATRLGPRLEAWLTPTAPRLGPTSLADWVALRAGLAAARAARLRVPWPVHVPASEPVRVARVLADHVRAGEAPVLDATAGACVRVVAAARESSVDITGTLCRGGGEPLTPARLAAVRDAGCTAVCHYSMAELSRVALACGRPAAPDDTHLLEDKLALVPRPRGDGTASLFLTSVSRHTPKLFLNVDTGDTAVVEKRDCGCLVGSQGLRTHLHTIRSPEKLTSEGVTFLTGDVLHVVETVLPARFGGVPTDYQIVEREVDGRSRISVVISPRLGLVDEEEAARTVLSELATGPSYRRMMVETLVGADAVDVERREPFVTDVGKIPVLHKVP